GSSPWLSARGVRLRRQFTTGHHQYALLTWRPTARASVLRASCRHKRCPLGIVRGYCPWVLSVARGMPPRRRSAKKGVNRGIPARDRRETPCGSPQPGTSRFSHISSPLALATVAAGLLGGPTGLPLSRAAIP